MKRRFQYPLAFLTASILAAGCADKRSSPQMEEKASSESRILTLYDQLTNGMTRNEVEKIVGNPLGQPIRQPTGEAEYHYIDKPERQMESHESPWSWSGLVLTYKDDKLIDKKYNFQWVKREHREAYEQRRISEQTLRADGEDAAAQE